MKYSIYIIAFTIVSTIAIAQETGFHLHTVPWYVWALSGITALAILRASTDKG